EKARESSRGVRRPLELSPREEGPRRGRGGRALRGAGLTERARDARDAGDPEVRDLSTVSLTLPLEEAVGRALLFFGLRRAGGGPVSLTLEDDLRRDLTETRRAMTPYALFKTEDRRRILLLRREPPECRRRPEKPQLVLRLAPPSSPPYAGTWSPRESACLCRPDCPSRRPKRTFPLEF